MSKKSRQARRDRRLKKWRGYLMGAAFGGPIGVGGKAVKDLKKKDDDKKAATKAGLRDDVPDDKYLGGSRGEEQTLYKEARAGKQAATAREEEAYKAAQEDKAYTKRLADGSTSDYSAYQFRRAEADKRNQDSISGIGSAARTARGLLGEAGTQATRDYDWGATVANNTRNSALNTNQLTGTAENVLQQRTAQIAATPSIGSLTDTSLLQNAQNAQQQLGANAGMLNRQAMGLAAGQGEGSALAMQAALAGAGQGASDALVQNQLQQNDLAAQLRFAAAQQQRQQDLAEADYASQLRMSTAGAERQAQLGFAGANADQLAQAAQQRAATGLQVAGQQAELTYNPAVQQQQAQAQAAQQALAAQQLANQRNLGLVGQTTTVGQSNEQASLENKGQGESYQSGLLTAKYGAAQDREGDRPTWKKIVMPLGILGN